jgi:hypothetical protein
MTRRQKNNRLGPTAGGRELRLAARPPARFNLLPDTPNYITVPETKTGVPNDLLTQNLRCLLSMSQRGRESFLLQAGLKGPLPLLARFRVGCHLSPVQCDGGTTCNITAELLHAQE